MIVDYVDCPIKTNIYNIDVPICFHDVPQDHTKTHPPENQKNGVHRERRDFQHPDMETGHCGFHQHLPKNGYNEGIMGYTGL